MSEIVKKEKDRVRRMIRVITQEYPVEEAIAKIKKLKSDYECTVNEQEDIFYASFWMSAVFEYCDDYLQVDASDGNRWEILRNFIHWYRTDFLCHIRDYNEWTETDENITKLAFFNHHLLKYCLSKWFLDGADLRCDIKRIGVYFRMQAMWTSVRY
jgi:hypothetical protein